MNADGKMFKIESPEGEPMTSDNSKRRLGVMDWAPVTDGLRRWKNFHQLMVMAGAKDNQIKTICELHKAMDRGLVAMSREWNDRLIAMLDAMQDIQKIAIENEDMPNKLDEIITHATKMRALL